MKADILIFLDEELLAGIVLDPVQDSFPWYEGTISEGPALGAWRELVEIYNAAALEFDYCPHHPDEGPYEETDLSRYVELLTRLRDAGGGAPKEEIDVDDPWLAPWLVKSREELERYLGFLDWRRWRAVTQDGQVVEGVPLPVDL